MKLFPWQTPIAEAVSDALSTSSRALLASATGSGKTYITASLIDRPTIIIAPKATHSAWRSVLDGFGVSRHIRELTNPERISRGLSESFASDRVWRVPREGLLVFDEPQKGISGPASQATEAILRLRAWKEGRILLLSATIASSPLSLRAVGGLFGLHDGSLRGFYEWARRYGCRPEPVPGSATKYRWVFRPPDRALAMRLIRKAFGKSFISLSQSDIPDFPRNLISPLLLDLSESDAAALRKAYSEMPSRVASSLRELERRRDAGDAVNPDVLRLRARQKIEWLKARMLADLALDTIAEGRSPVVFLNFRDTAFRVEELLRSSDPSLRIVRILGGEDPGPAIEAFQHPTSPADVAICTLSAGGTGISLHDVHRNRPRTAIICPGDSATDVKQAMGRVWRVGGTDAATLFPFAANTIEESVFRSMKRKIENIDTLNDSDLST